MKVLTDKGMMVQLDHIRFTHQNFQLLYDLQISSPNVRMEGRDMETGRPVRIPLWHLQLVWREVNQMNL